MFIIDRWKHNKKVERFVRYVDSSIVEDDNVIGVNTFVGST